MMTMKKKKDGAKTKMATAGAKATAKRSPPHPMLDKSTQKKKTVRLFGALTNLNSHTLSSVAKM